MKRLLILAIALAAGQSGFCQGDSQAPCAEKLVASIMSAQGGLILSMQEKAIAGLGDRAAMGLIRHIAGQRLSDPRQVTRVLRVIRMAYEVPGGITSEADREPKATLLLLSYLSLLPVSENSKAEIEKTRTYVLRQISEYKAKHATEKN